VVNKDFQKAVND